MTARAETLEKIGTLAGEGYKYGFFTDIESQLPMEFAVEAQKLLAISLEGSVG